MPLAKRIAIDLPSGYLSAEAASFVAQMDNLSERMNRDTRELAAADLCWQSAPGMNTIGMLLAHIAIVEVYWIRRVMADDPESERHLEEVLGIQSTMDGMPMPSGGRPPEGLARDYTFFEDLLARARSYTTSVARQLADGEMGGEIEVVNNAGAWIVNPRWAFYHILEHQAGHYGQILLLKHLLAHDREPVPRG
jgi:uncharacterized damage-inducible protein DinB